MIILVWILKLGGISKITCHSTERPRGRKENVGGNVGHDEVFAVLFLPCL